jgi:hypothetical protein
MFYSRNSLLSLRNCWKTTSQPSLALSTMPLTRCVWENMKSLNLLIPRRGLRGGRNRQTTTTVTTGSSLPPILNYKNSNYACRTPTTLVPKAANLYNSLNIQSEMTSIKTIIMVQKPIFSS